MLVVLAKRMVLVFAVAALVGEGTCEVVADGVEDVTGEDAFVVAAAEVVAAVVVVGAADVADGVVVAGVGEVVLEQLARNTVNNKTSTRVRPNRDSFQDDSLITLLSIDENYYYP